MPRSDASASVSVERFYQFALLGLVASGFLAVAGSGYLDLPTTVVTTACLALRALMICGLRLDFSERLITVVTTAYAGFFLLDYFLLSHELLAAAVHLAFFLAMVKVLTAKAGRDSFYLIAIAVIELLAAALLSIDLKFFLALAFYLLFAIAALTSAEIRRSIRRSTARTARGGLGRFHTRLALLALLIAIGVLTLTAGMFFILPRTADAALSRFARRDYMPGFSNQVTLGQIGRIKTDSRPMMHIRITSGEAPLGLKWRGGSLADFDGRRWSNLDFRRTRIPVQAGQADLSGNAYSSGFHIGYHVDFDALDSGTLFFAGEPEKVDLRRAYVYRGEGGNYTLDSRPPDDFRYDAYSLLAGPPEVSPPVYPPPVLPLEARERYLQLPAALDLRIPALARSMAAQAGTDLEKARAVESRLRDDYGYTLELPRREPADPLAYFLFTRRKGHCEYFASAMTVMLRTLGVPARLATGFQSGEYNPLTDLWVVRASDAHSWVEAWIPGYGWATFDPTPPDPNARSFAFLTSLGLYLDAAHTVWQDWVVGYDVGRQGTLADRLEQGARRAGIRWFGAFETVQSWWRGYSARVTKGLAIRVGTVIAVAFAIWLMAPPLIRVIRMRRRVERVRRGQASVADATLLYQRMLHVLKRKGFQKPAWFTPAEFARSLPAGAIGATVAEFTSAYNAVRFGGRTDAAPHLSALLDRLEQRS